MTLGDLTVTISDDIYHRDWVVSSQRQDKEVRIPCALNYDNFLVFGKRTTREAVEMPSSSRTMVSVAVVAAAVLAIAVTPVDAFAPSPGLVNPLASGLSRNAPIALSTRRLAPPSLRKSLVMTATQNPASSKGLGWDSHKVGPPSHLENACRGCGIPKYPPAASAPLPLLHPKECTGTSRHMSPLDLATPC
jgi:hypothetical protein